MKKILAAFLMALAFAALAQGNLEINTPAVAALKSSMQGRHGQLEPHFAAGAIGLTRDGRVALRDANLVPLAQRGAINSLLAAENRDRAALYQEIAKANSHPEWEDDIARTFGSRWIDKARAGWWVQDAQGNWTKK